MNTDFRISVTLTRHPKTRRLIRRLGPGAFYNLVCLWTFTAVYKPRGVFNDMTTEEVEDAAEWDGEPGEFVRTLIDLRFLDADEDGTLSAHDWREHNGYASSAQDRSAKARMSSRARWDKGNEHDAQSGNEHDAPSPSPSPSPSPNEKDFCAEPAQAPPAAPQPDEPVPKPALTFPLAGKGETFAITEADIAEWQESFPGVDVHQALRHCLQWNRDNPNRRKTRNGIRRHITGWLAKAQNEARASPPGNNRPQYPQPMTARQRYMHELGEAIFPEPDEEPRHEPIDITPAPRQLEPPARPAATPGRAAP